MRSALQLPEGRPGPSRGRALGAQLFLLAPAIPVCIAHETLEAHSGRPQHPPVWVVLDVQDRQGALGAVAHKLGAGAAASLAAVTQPPWPAAVKTPPDVRGPVQAGFSLFPDGRFLLLPAAGGSPAPVDLLRMYLHEDAVPVTRAGVTYAPGEGGVMALDGDSLIFASGDHLAETALAAWRQGKGPPGGDGAAGVDPALGTMRLDLDLIRRSLAGVSPHLTAAELRQVAPGGAVPAHAYALAHLVAHLPPGIDEITLGIRAAPGKLVLESEPGLPGAGACVQERDEQSAGGEWSVRLQGHGAWSTRLAETLPMMAWLLDPRAWLQDALATLEAPPPIDGRGWLSLRVEPAARSALWERHEARGDSLPLRGDHQHFRLAVKGFCLAAAQDGGRAGVVVVLTGEHAAAWLDRLAAFQPLGEAPDGDAAPAPRPRAR